MHDLRTYAVCLGDENWYIVGRNEVASEQLFSFLDASINNEGKVDCNFCVLENSTAIDKNDC